MSTEAELDTAGKQLRVDLHWLKVAGTIAEQSKCDKRGIGAVVLKDGRVASTGYNGAPAGFPDHGTQSCKEFCPAAMNGQRASCNDFENCVAVHAEINALLFTNRDDLRGATIYVPYSICLSCAKAIANSGIVRVVWRPGRVSKRVDDARTENYLRICGIEVRHL